jgi:hypothetical protein
MSRRRSAQSHNSTPALEQRVLLAGNVTVSRVTTNGLTDIVITGDSSSNSIEIVQNSTDVYTVRGLSSTRINGVMGRTFTFEFDDFDDLRISMNAGNDYLAIKGNSSTATGDLDITDDLDISMGSGTDRVNINFVQVKGDMFVDMGSSNDKLNIKNTKLGDDSADGEISDLNINGGDGNDSLNLFRNTIEGLTNRTSTLTPTSKDLWF